MTSQIILRDMQPDDGPAIASLMTEDKTATIATHFIIDAYTALVQGDDQRTSGIVAEDTSGVVGLVTVSFSSVQYEGDVLPTASIDSLQVSSKARGHGLGGRLTDAAVERARAEFGDQGVITAGLASGNDASRATASRWCREFFEPFRGVMAPVRKQPPGTLKGISVRSATHDDLEEIAVKQNQYFKDYNLYTRVTATSLAEMLQMAPGQEPLYDYIIAVTPDGEIIAGALLRFRCTLMIDKIENLPLPLRVMGSLLRMLPSDNIMREIGVSNLWFLPGQNQAAAHLWQMTRWLCKDRGSTLLSAFDPNSGMQEIFGLKPWHVPKIDIALALHGPTPLSGKYPITARNRR